MPANPDALQALKKGDAAFSQGNYNLAEKTYESAVKNFAEECAPHERLGNFHYFTGRLDLALGSLIRAHQLGTADLLTLFNLGRIFLLGHELLDRGRFFLDRVMAAVPKYGPVIHTYLGVLFFLRGGKDEAVDLFLRVRLASPLREPLEFFLGCAYHDLGKEDLAERHYRHALSLDGGNGETLLAMGNLAFSRGAYDRALELYEKALESSSDFVSAHQNAIVALQYLGRSPESLFHKKALKKLSSRGAGRRGITLEEPGLLRETGVHLEKLLFFGTKLHEPAPSLLQLPGL